MWGGRVHVMPSTRGSMTDVRVQGKPDDEVCGGVEGMEGYPTSDAPGVHVYAVLTCGWG